MFSSRETSAGDFLTPPGLVDRPDDALRARAWTATCLVTAPLATAFGALRWASGSPGLALLDLGGALCFLGSAVYLQHTGNLRRSVHFSSAVGLLLLAQAVFLGGGLAGPSVAWYGMVPMSASVGLGPRSGLSWVMLVLPLPLASMFAAQLGWVAGGAFGDISQALMYTFFVAGLAGLAWTYERFTEIARRARDEAEEALDEEQRKTSDLVGARSQFVKNVSHEFRTPLNHILGATQLLSHTDLDEDQRDLVSIAETSGSSLLGIIDGAIEAHGVEETDIALENELVDLELLTLRCARRFSGSARRKGVDLVVELDPTLPPRACGDPRRIEQVVCALLENAVGFTRVGSIHLRVIYRGRGRVRFEVEDTGIGIEAKNFERIFQPFRQVDESDTRVRGGLGAGLAVCRRLARTMNGDVTVQSTVGTGSIFTFDVVVREGSPVVTENLEPVDASSKTRPTRILLADGNPRTLTGFLGTLKKMGLPAEGVGTQQELVSTIQAHPFDVVFVDLDLPGLGSIEDIIATIAADPAVQGSCLVALTRFDQAKEGRVPPGFHDQLPKPLRREQVVEILRRWTSAERRRVA